MEESGSAARLILVVLGDHGQTSDAKARWRSNHRLLVRWYQIIPSRIIPSQLGNHSLKRVVETTNQLGPQNQLLLTGSHGRKTCGAWQNKRVDHRKYPKHGSPRPSALIMLLQVPMYMNKSLRILDTLQKKKVSYQACQRDPGGLINHPFRESLSIIFAIMWLGNVGKLLVAPWLRIQWGIWISVLAAASWLPPNQQTVI